MGTGHRTLATEALERSRHTADEAAPRAGSRAGVGQDIGHGIAAGGL